MLFCMTQRKLLEDILLALDIAKPASSEILDEKQ